MGIVRTAEIDIDDDTPGPLPLPSFDQILAVLSAIGAVIGARLALILSLVAAAALTWRVVSAPDPAPNAVWSLLIFCALVAWLVYWTPTRSK